MTTDQRRNGIQWTLWSQLDDLDFAEDLALLSHSRQQMQDKTTRLMDISAKVGLSIHKQKTKVMKVNTASIEPVLLENRPLEEVESFSFTLWCRDMEDNKSYSHQSTNFHQQLPPEYPESALARQD